MTNVVISTAPHTMVQADVLALSRGARVAVVGSEGDACASTLLHAGHDVRRMPMGRPVPDEFHYLVAAGDEASINAGKRFACGRPLALLPVEPQRAAFDGNIWEGVQQFEGTQPRLVVLCPNKADERACMVALFGLLTDLLDAWASGGDDGRLAALVRLVRQAIAAPYHAENTPKVLAKGEAVRLLLEKPSVTNSIREALKIVAEDAFCPALEGFCYYLCHILFHQFTNERFRGILMKSDVVRLRALLFEKNQTPPPLFAGGKSERDYPIQTVVSRAAVRELGARLKPFLFDQAVTSDWVGMTLDALMVASATHKEGGFLQQLCNNGALQGVQNHDKTKSGRGCFSV